MRLGALLALLAALAAAPATALAYGTSTAYVASASAGPGSWGPIAGAQGDADGDAAATLSEADAAGEPAVILPSNTTFSGSAAGWSSASSCSLLCTVTNAYDDGSGNPSGSIATSFATALGLLSTATGVGTWSSDSFTWTAGAPGAVTVALDRRATVSGLLAVGGTATYAVRLVDETVPGSTTLLSGTLTGDDAGWVPLSASPAPGVVVSGHAYHLEIATTFTAAVALLSGHSVTYDNVTLSVRPQNQRADGEMRVTGVPPGSTWTLELRARTEGGEDFAVKVWDGAAWNDRLTVSATSYQAQSYGLTPAEWNGGTVRVRLVDSQQGVDATAGALSVEYLRVVATGGITVSGPASVALPGVTLDGVSSQVSTATLGPVEVVDSGGAASGWALTATATPFALAGDPGTQLPADAFTVAPAAPTTPDGSDMTGVSAGAGGVLRASPPVTVMQAAAGRGIGTYRQSAQVFLTVPPNAARGTYQSTVTLTAS